MSAYYNEIDPVAAKWLRNLIAAGHIAPGDVDERSIEDVVPTELAGYTQCHFFAGIGVWSLALRNAGWPDDRAVWTGSCPCQPFSSAGKGEGFADERHLWPAFFYLISQCRPATVFGEQVASRDGLGWLDVVHADLEGEGYAVAAADLCAAGVGAPHIRQRLWFVGVAKSDGRSDGEAVIQCGNEVSGKAKSQLGVRDTGAFNVVGNANSERRDRFDALQYEKRDCTEIAGAGEISALAHTSSTRPQEQCWRRIESPRLTQAGFTRGFWADADWLYCRDGKYRPVEPGTFPMAASTPGRVGRLRAYGNAINAEAAKAFIKSTGLV